MEIKQLEIACPCCKSRLLVDVRTGQILRTQGPVATDETGKSKASGADWGRAVGRVQARQAGGQDKLEAALEHERRREHDLDDLFRKARKRAEEAEAEAPRDPAADAPEDV